MIVIEDRVALAIVGGNSNGGRADVAGGGRAGECARAGVKGQPGGSGVPSLLRGGVSKRVTIGIGERVGRESECERDADGRVLIGDRVGDNWRWIARNGEQELVEDRSAFAVGGREANVADARVTGGRACR